MKSPFSSPMQDLYLLVARRNRQDCLGSDPVLPSVGCRHIALASISTKADVNFSRRIEHLVPTVCADIWVVRTYEAHPSLMKFAKGMMLSLTLDVLY